MGAHDVPAAFGGDPRLLLQRACPALREAAVGTAPVQRFGALLAGPTGAGKSSIAAWLVRRWLAAQPRTEHPSGWLGYSSSVGSVAWLDALEATDAERRYKLGTGDPEDLANAYRADWVVLDDVGKRASAPLIELILARRYAAALPTIVTTGLTPAELVDHIGAASIRRIVEFEGKPGLLVDAFKVAA